MLGVIEKKAKELEQEERERPQKEREKVIEEIKKFLEKDEEESPEIQQVLEKFAKKIENTPVNDLSSIKEKTSNFILEKRYKRKRLY